MTDDKLRSVLHFYAAELGVAPVRCPDDPTDPSHLVWMCLSAINHVAVGNRDKAMRWLGFVQGVLVARDVYTLDEVRSHSRTTEEEVNA